jgi:hypothetical protein
LKRSTTSFEWQAVAYAHKMREEPKYCWRDKDANLVKWSPEAVRYFNSLTEEQIQNAKGEYSASIRK